MNAIVLKIRWSGGEGDVFLFNSKKLAEQAVYSYYEEYADYAGSDIDEFEEFLFRKDIGYFTITEQRVMCE
jgi:hypothetical protein